MDLNSTADGMRWALLIILALASLEKAERLHSGHASDHSAIHRWAALRRYPRLVMTASLFADILASVLLVLEPSMGGVAAISLLTSYSTAALGRSDEDTWGEITSNGCQCLPGSLETKSAKGLLARNGVLVIFAGVVSGVSPTPSFPGMLWAAVLLTLLAKLVAAIEGSNSTHPAVSHGHAIAQPAHEHKDQDREALH